MAMTPIEVEVLRNAMGSIVDEAYISLMKSAYSTNIKERRDHSTAIFDAGGRVIVQGESMPLHLASMLGLVEVVLEKHGLDHIRPGDMFISNDPFVGRGSHLPDVAMVMPVFADGEPVLFVSNIAHHADIGGMAPGSMAGGMTEIYQEGLRIPPIRLFRGGTLDRDIMDLILLNVRVTEERRGDYNAQIAANRLAARRCEQILAKWTAPVIREGCGRIVAAVEKRIRASVAALPDGVYRFEDILDDDGRGGAGARSYADGTDGVQVHMTNTSNLPVEALENEYPLMIERYELVEDSGGAGTWRGGLGLRRVYRPLGHVVNFSGQGERCVNAPWGVFGGGPGATGRFELRSRDGEVTRIANKPSSLQIGPDTSIVVTTAGAGGYGPAGERAVEAIDEDHRSGKFDPAYLEREYEKAR